MLFWSFMLVMCIFLPVFILVTGIIFEKKSPGNINYVFGYRTARSMKSKEAWDFAHHAMGRIWKRLGLVLTILVPASMAICIGRDTETVGIFGTVIISVQTVCVIASIFPVESALKKNFDENGKYIGK